MGDDPMPRTDDDREAGGGWTPPRASSPSPSDVTGTRFAGRVVDVSDQGIDRSPPAASPVLVSGAVLAVAAVLPLAVRLLPVLVALVTLVILIRPRKVRPRRILRRARRRDLSTPATRFRAHTFSVRLVDETGRPGAVLACRLLTRTPTDCPPPLLGGEYVEGRGRSRPGDDTVEVRELVVESGPTYRAARLRSPVPVAAASGAMLLVAVALIAARWERLRDLAGDQVVPTVAAVVVPTALFCVFRIYRRRRKSRS